MLHKKYVCRLKKAGTAFVNTSSSVGASVGTFIKNVAISPESELMDAEEVGIDYISKRVIGLCFECVVLFVCSWVCVCVCVCE